MRATPAIWWLTAGALVAVAVARPDAPLALTPVAALPGVGPEPWEHVAASAALLVLVGCLDAARAAWWDRVLRGI